MNELRQLVIAEVERSERIPQHVREELVCVLEIGWNSTVPILNVDKLLQLSESVTAQDSDVVRFEVVTAIVLDPRKDPNFDLLMEFENFLRRPSDLQDQVLKPCALITNVATNAKVYWMPIDFVHSRAAALARCFTDNRPVIIDAIVNALRIWASVRRPDSQSLALTKPPQYEFRKGQ